MLALPDALGPLVDGMLTQFYFSAAEDEEEISPRRKALSFALFLPLVLLALRGLGNYTLFRFALRAACYLLYLRSAKGIGGGRGAFLAVFTASCFVASQNIFLSPLISSALGPFSFQGGSPWLFLLFSTAVRLLVVLPLRRLLPPGHISAPTPASWLPLAATVFCIMLTRQLRWSGEGFSGGGDLLFLLLQVFMLLFLVVFERESYRTRQEREARFQSAVSQERIRVYEAQYQASIDLRGLHHDMKNHLLAIRALAGEGADRDGRLREYLDGLLAQTDTAAPTAETGNQALDGLLFQKRALLREEGVRLELILDLRDVGPLSDMDLCAIFGNAVDNALEACRKVEPREERYLSIHGERSAGQLIVTIKNPYRGQIRLRRGLPVTSKADPLRHGIGLASIRRTVQKYGGVAEVDLSVPEQFCLTLLIPLSPPQ